MPPSPPGYTFWCQKCIPHDNQQHQGTVIWPDASDSVETSHITVWNSSSSTPPTHHIPPGPTYTDLLSSVLMVAAKFHRLTLNSTLVALCYLSVISHVHSCLAKKWRKCSRVFLRVCALLWMIKTSCKVKRKCEMCGWEKDVLLAQCVVKFVIDATF